MELALRLVRHGATEWTADRRYTGQADISLTTEGRAQARALLGELDGEYDSVWCSDLARAVHTARLAGLDARPTALLREFDFGDIEGCRWDDLDPVVQAGLLAFDGFVAPGGESVMAFGQRVDTFVDSLEPGRHLLVTHGGVIRHLSRRAAVDTAVAPAGWIDLELDR